MNIFSSFFKQGPEKQDEKEQLVMQDNEKEQAVQAETQVNSAAPAADAQAAASGEERRSMPLVEPGSVEEQIKGALRQIYDPEIGLEVIQLGLIREIDLKADEPEVKMMLTTPFCPYGGWLIQQVKDVSESIVGKPIKVTVLPDMWDPNYMEDPGLLMGW